ncbi:sprouty-related, EVH1 domain-containing protein 1 isoform X1 [Trichogramma pretiosum]|uniref:sprouty-related, EVH1 domain-containing protein 1 isoform X1 n=1 Tax=Trichogramma pretiosum TaxID=7493 RepID=UPI0006C96C32|nr:sprouty-related, EVH1 domain-containing protein 1 isoform X1 [Trichogramma pretiosum]
MTDTSDDGDYLVRVRAQVMTRDDSTGGWLPLSGGGLAIVSVRRRPVAINVLNGSENNTSEKIQNTNNGPTSTAPTITPTHMPKKRHEYLIHGKRITDQSVVLSCTIKRDFEYNKVMPTFHHWRTGEKKFGLTFQTAADARAFDKGVRTAVDELLEGLVITYPANETTDSDGGDDVFMTLNLPAEAPDPSRVPISETSAVANRAQAVHNAPPAGQRHTDHCLSTDNTSQRPIHYISSPSMGKPLPPAPPLSSDHHRHNPADLTGDNYPYVQLTTLNHHEYLYPHPVIDDQQQHHHKPTSEKLDRSNSQGSLKKPDILVNQPSTKGNDSFTGKGSITRGSDQFSPRTFCQHCRKHYLEAENRRGACAVAPDPVKRGVEIISCIPCAKGMFYHCVKGSEDDSEDEFEQSFEQIVCSCERDDKCGRRWFGLAFLSLFVPCLWLYPPLRATHWCGTSCGLWGGKHSYA